MPKALTPIVLVVCIVATCTAQEKKEPRHVTCEETEVAVLKPFRASVDAGQLALAKYEEQNSAWLKKAGDYVVRLSETDVVYEKARQKETAEFDRRIRLGNEAIAEIQADYQKKVAAIQKSLAEAMASKNERNIKRFTASLETLRKNMANHKITGYQGKLGFSKNIPGWTQFVTDETKKKAERMALFGKGEVRIYHGFLGRTATWNQILALIKAKETEIAKALNRERVFYLSPFGRSLDGKGTDEELDKRLSALAKARAEIAAGTFRLYVSLFGTQSNRNEVQKRMADAEEKLRQTTVDWNAKKYKSYNPKFGRGISNGDIEKMIADKEKELADFIALGDDAKVYVAEAGNNLTGTACRANAATAAGKGDNKGIKRWTELYQHWKTAREKWIAAKRADIQKFVLWLAEHQEIFRADLKKQRKHIDTTLTWALGQTPCGGGYSSGKILVDSHRDKLGKLGETPEESQRRIDDYNDKIFVEADGTVHGDPRNAWADAMRDTGISDPRGKAETAAGNLLIMKDVVDYLSAFRDIQGAKEAAAELRSLIEKLESLSKTDRDFLKVRAALRADVLGKLKGLLDKGFLSEERLQDLHAALVKSGSKRHAGKTIQELVKLRGAVQDFKKTGMPTIQRLLADAKGLRQNATAAYTSYVNQTVTQVRNEFGASLKNMSGLDRSLLVLSVAATAAEVVQRTEAGMSLPEAIARSGTNFVIDVAIAGIPIAAAAEIATQVLFTSASAAMGDGSIRQATLSSTSKFLAEQAFDVVATGGSLVGEASILLERKLTGEPGIAKILANVDTAQLQRSLQTVESRIASLAPGHADESRLMKMRETFRELLRAKKQLD